MTDRKPTVLEPVIASLAPVSEPEPDAHDVVHSVDSVRAELAKSHERIQTLEQKARQLASFVESLCQQTRLQFDCEIAALGQKAQDLAASVETLRETTLVQSDSAMALLTRTHARTVALNAQLVADIGERKRAEKSLRKSEEALVDLHRRKDEFLAMLSHELRNPLAPILNATHLLRLQKHEDPIQQHAREIIERQVGQLKHLIDDLLEVSRISTGRVQLRQEPMLLHGIVERAVETTSPLLVQRRHRVEVSVPTQAIWLHADAARLEQVLVNLLTNAGKYTDEGGQIWLSVEQEGDAAVLRVRDTGVGIADELLPHIFELFTQADRSLDRSQGGLGIGLCLVQRLVELHGGSVAVASVLGQGSEFVVRLPVLPSPPPLPSQPTDKLPGSGRKRSVLVVDDNVDAAQSLAQLLEISGHQVQVAHDGPNALLAALEMQPEVILLDIGLPGLSGWEVAARIRELPILKHLVLVALTGYGQDLDRVRSQAAGFDHHLVKPADFATLQRILA